MNITAIIEGLLFVSGEDGLSLEEICNITDKTKEDITFGLKELYKIYEEDNRGINIEYLGNKFKLTTKIEHKEYYKKMIKDEENSVLSQSSLETLAIIAYNGPITRVDVDEIRGVNSSYVVRKLLLKGLIEEVGRSDVAGKPRIYNVTSKFLDYFGLGSINELPEIINNDIEETDNNINLFKSKYKEEQEKTDY